MTRFVDPKQMALAVFLAMHLLLSCLSASASDLSLPLTKIAIHHSGGHGMSSTTDAFSRTDYSCGLSFAAVRYVSQPAPLFDDHGGFALSIRHHSQNKYVVDFGFRLSFDGEILETSASTIIGNDSLLPGGVFSSYLPDSYLIQDSAMLRALMTNEAIPQQIDGNIDGNKLDFRRQRRSDRKAKKAMLKQPKDLAGVLREPGGLGKAIPLIVAYRNVRDSLMTALREAVEQAGGIDRFLDENAPELSEEVLAQILPILAVFAQEARGDGNDIREVPQQTSVSPWLRKRYRDKFEKLSESIPLNIDLKKYNLGYAKFSPGWTVENWYLSGIHFITDKEGTPVWARISASYRPTNRQRGTASRVLSWSWEFGDVPNPAVKAGESNQLNH
jgi:hypothetical protein